MPVGEQVTYGDRQRPRRAWLEQEPIGLARGQECRRSRVTGDHDDGQMFRARIVAQAMDEVEPGGEGNDQIHHNDRRMTRTRLPERLLGVFRRDRLESQR